MYSLQFGRAGTCLPVLLFVSLALGMAGSIETAAGQSTGDAVEDIFAPVPPTVSTTYFGGIFLSHEAWRGDLILPVQEPLSRIGLQVFESTTGSLDPLADIREDTRVELLGSGQNMYGLQLVEQQGSVIAHYTASTGAAGLHVQLHPRSDTAAPINALAEVLQSHRAIYQNLQADRHFLAVLFDNNAASGSNSLIGFFDIRIVPSLYALPSVTDAEMEQIWSMARFADSNAPSGVPDPLPSQGSVEAIADDSLFSLNESCNSSVNLIENGGFESPVISGAWDVTASGTAGWQVDWLYPGGPLVANLELQAGNAAEGSQYTELDSDWQGPAGENSNNETPSVRISQLLSTVPGQRYRLSFAFKPRSHPDGLLGDNKLLVTWQGVPLTDEPLTLESPTTWTYYSFEIEAQSSQTLLSFEDAGIPDTFGTLLDDVEVTCLPTDVPKNDKVLFFLHGWGYSGKSAMRSLWQRASSDPFFKKKYSRIAFVHYNYSLQVGPARGQIKDGMKTYLEQQKVGTEYDVVAHSLGTFLGLDAITASADEKLWGDSGYTFGDRAGRFVQLGGVAHGQDISFPINRRGGRRNALGAVITGEIDQWVMAKYCFGGFGRGAIARKMRKREGGVPNATCQLTPYRSSREVQRMLNSNKPLLNRLKKCTIYSNFDEFVYRPRDSGCMREFDNYHCTRIVSQPISHMGLATSSFSYGLMKDLCWDDSRYRSHLHTR